MSLYILRAMYYWMDRMSDFENQYWTMPFGSYIAVGLIRADIRDMEFYLIPNYQTQGLWLLAHDRREEWVKYGEVV